MTSKTIVDISKIEKALSQEANKKRQAAFAKRVAFEIRDYVPYDQGTLRESEALASNYETGTIEWQTPYAKKVHALPETSINKAKNPKAKAKWHEAAKKDRIEAWKEYAKKLMES